MEHVHLSVDQAALARLRPSVSVNLPTHKLAQYLRSDLAGDFPTGAVAQPAILPSALDNRLRGCEETAEADRTGIPTAKPGVAKRWNAAGRRRIKTRCVGTPG